MIHDPNATPEQIAAIDAALTELRSLSGAFDNCISFIGGIPGFPDGYYLWHGTDEDDKGRAIFSMLRLGNVEQAVDEIKREHTQILDLFTSRGRVGYEIMTAEFIKWDRDDDQVAKARLDKIMPLLGIADYNEVKRQAARTMMRSSLESALGIH